MSELRVLGSGAQATGSGSRPDPIGAVTFAPGSPSLISAATPEERWTAAVKARPLSAPVPLPGPLLSLSRAITGRRQPISYTTGSATRHALRAAGARGATTGDVIHLPEPPNQTRESLGLLAHELTHTRSPVSRPRFLLAGHQHTADTDERQALEAGDNAVESFRSSAMVGDLPVGGGNSAVVEVARRTAEAAVRRSVGAGADPMSGTVAGATASGDVAGGGVAGVTSWDRYQPPTAGGSAGGLDAGAPAAGSAAGVNSSTTAGPGTGAQPDMDRVVEALEQRLLIEMERRGGRWAGVF